MTKGEIRPSDIGVIDDDSVKKAFGEKKITTAGSFCLNLNNNTGAGMVILPLVCQQAGWFTPIVAVIVTFILSSFAATMLCEAMQMIPGNKTFEKRFEFATTVEYYWGKRYYKWCQVFYTISMQALNIASMIISAQVVDQMILEFAGSSYALDYQTWPPSFIGSSNSTTNPWKVHGQDANPTFILSIGFIVVMAICIPLGYINLDDNMWFQWFSMAGMVGLLLVMFVTFSLRMSGTDCVYYGDTPNVCVNATINATNGQPIYHNDTYVTHNGRGRTPFFILSGQSQVIGSAVFTFAYVVTIPSWVNEKKHGVNINKSIWWSGFIGTILKIGLGLTGAWAYQLLNPDGSPRNGASDILNMAVLADNNMLTRYSGYFWDISSLIPGIPVVAIMVRYNLLSGRVCGPFWSFFWGVVFPWIVTAFCYETNLLLTICTWASILVAGFINFVVPCLLYRSALLKRQAKGAALNIQDPMLDQSNDNGDFSDEHTKLMDAMDIEDDDIEPIVHAVPDTIPWITYKRVEGRYKLSFGRVIVNKIGFATFLSVFFSIVSVVAIVQNIVSYIP